MGTRGIIARRTGAGTFVGVYHHWDSYPEGLGATLWHAYHNYFARDLEKMLQYLTAHSWSTIVAKDLSKEPGWGDVDGVNRPACYCHGGRNESVTKMTETSSVASGCEYAYVFYSHDQVDRMAVYASFHQDATKMIGAFGMGDEDASWRLLSDTSDFDLNDEQPRWRAL